MASPEDTGTATITLLESRLHRIEHILYGPSETAELPAPPTIETLADLERRFASLVSGVRVYAELLKIYKTYPSLFRSPPPNVPPTQLDPDALRATVLSYASAFPSTASALSATVNDTPVPDTALSVQLVALLPRMEALEASQRELDAEIARLRSRSERVVRQYYEDQALATSQLVASVEGRFERVEGRVRRLERERQEAADGI